ncbi:two-component regulator propeller domain-containing protein [Sphingomonas sp. BIUV-7]|uniref:Two-component regulator propeller domain-containing protein n=1 Tax=Sphingomonas natans TaxID=3063330 RepID=A0ABT8Y7A1_9SPHN|nr:sensor histidine kinase [Sphingomonas sp. BIUV-7]MDO6414200.1 two-component regulator propeller domain-containing protein [Sphingomonas sp. BIUV-7]
MPRNARICLAALLILLTGHSAAWGTSADVGQFTHSSWTSKDGIPGMVQALAQTRDGYLWLGTYEGLYRFDGVSFDRIRPPAGHPSGSIPVSALLVTRNGRLWVGYAGGAGVEVLRGGTLHRMGMPNPPGEVTGLAEDADGAVWVVGGRGRKALKRYSSGKWQSINSSWGVPDDEAVSAVYPAKDGTVWVATQKRILILRRGERRFVDGGIRVSNGAGLAQDRKGRMWLSDASGTRLLPDRDSRTQAAPRPEGSSRSARRISLMFDRQGDLWGSTFTDGVFRLANAGQERAATAPIYFRTSEGLTSNEAVAVLEDREGNIWVATELGLDQFRRANIESVSNLSNGSASGFMTASDARGDVYVAIGAALYFAAPNVEARQVLAGKQDIEAICRGGDAVWVVQRGRAVRMSNGKPLTTITWSGDKPTSGCGQDSEGHFWLSRPAGDLAIRRGSGWEEVELPGKRTPLDIYIDWKGLIVGTLSRKSVVIYDGRRWRELSSDKLGVSGLTVIYGNARTLLIGGGTGLARWDGHDVKRLVIDDHPWLRGIRGIVQTADGETWMINNRGIIRLATRDLERAFDDPKAAIPHDIFDEQDGFNSRTQNSQALQVALGRDSRLWFLTRQGVLRIDPAHLARNAVVPPVAIRAVSAGGRRYLDPTQLKLAPGLKNISIEYTGLSLTIPSRVRFRYRLRGFDTGWVDPGTRRQAFYTNLPPGDYTFEVEAANNDGVWNRRGVSLPIIISPTFIQTRTFLALCVAAAVALLWLLYRLRMHAIAERMRVRLSERLAERERIARELHDTLLQSIQALILRFQLAADDIPEDQPVRQSLEQALDRADTVLAEGRSRVRDLRITEAGGDIKRMINDIVERQVFSPDTQIKVESVGEPRAMDPIASDEIARIANEAIFNIWRHANATQLDIRIAFMASDFSVRFKDNGVGIPEEIMRHGHRSGHFGLPGMRERAYRIGASLSLVSSPANGTELKLRVPASVAYSQIQTHRRAQIVLRGKRRG